MKVSQSLSIVTIFTVFFVIVKEVSSKPGQRIDTATSEAHGIQRNISFVLNFGPKFDMNS